MSMNAQEFGPRVQSLLDQAVAAGDVPGVAVAIGDADGQIFEAAAGTRTMGGDQAMTPDTVVWIASMTKAITGTAAMQLVERGRLSLDGPAAEVLPELGRVQVLDGFDEAGNPRLRAPRGQITLRQLLTHTAGFSYDFWNADIVRCQEVMGLPPMVSCQVAALNTPLIFDPGERWEYGIGIDHTGRMIEAVTGRRLGEYLAEEVLGPLGMTDTAFRIRDDMRARLAPIHARGIDGGLAATDLEIPQDPEFEMGGGGLYGTVRDYLRFCRLFLNQGRADGGGQVLKPETVAQMSRNAMGDLRVRPLKAVLHDLTNDAEFFPGLPKSWGLSFMINEEDAPTGRPAGSLAWAGLANSYYWIDPKTGIAGVYATQILPFADAKSLPLYLAVEGAVYGR